MMDEKKTAHICMYMIQSMKIHCDFVFFFLFINVLLHFHSLHVFFIVSLVYMVVYLTDLKLVTF